MRRQNLGEQIFWILLESVSMGSVRRVLTAHDGHAVTTNPTLIRIQVGFVRCSHMAHRAFTSGIPVPLIYDSQFSETGPVRQPVRGSQARRLSVDLSSAMFP